MSKGQAMPEWLRQLRLIAGPDFVSSSAETAAAPTGISTISMTTMEEVQWGVIAMAVRVVATATIMEAVIVVIAIVEIVIVGIGTVEIVIVEIATVEGAIAEEQTAVVVTATAD